METVIAIGVIGFAVPLILAASTASMNDRRNAEADTRAAWLAQDLQHQIAAVWASPRRDTYLPQSVSLTFPEFGSKNSPVLFIYDNEAQFLGMGSSGDLQSGSKQNSAQYLVAAYAERQIPTNLSSSTSELSRIHIQVEYPAKAPKAKRQTLQFSVVRPEQQPF
jgi:type II secretory pathway pseudopilin PulG